jgi:alpha-L-rhamnosidase
MRKAVLGLLGIVTAGAMFCAVGWVSADDAMPKEQWKADWITAAETPQRDEVVLHFRKVIDVGTTAPAHFWVDVSADNQFLLVVNGARVGTGPSKADLAHWRFKTYDLGPFLHVGKNVLGATVWNFGVRAAVSQMSSRTGFLMRGETDAERAANTDTSWDVDEEKGISTLPPPSWPFYYAAGATERWDMGRMDWNWDTEATSSRHWSKAVSLGRGALRGETDAPNNWQLVADPLPPMEMREVPSGTVVRVVGIENVHGFPEKSLDIAPHQTVSVLLDRGALVTGYPELTVSGGAGSKIRLTYTEALFGDKWDKGNRNDIAGKHITGVADEILPDGATRQFVPLGWRTWRYLQIDVSTADAPLRIDGLKTLFSAFPFKEKGYFHSDDESLGKIWGIGWRTARLDAHDTYMDTPYWERLQYIGDTRIQAMVSYVVAGDDRLARQAIDAFNSSRVPDGLTQSRYPSSLVQMIPTFSLLWVGMVRDFWIYRGDEAFVRTQMAGVRDVMEWFIARQRADGLLGKIPWWPFVDWAGDFANGEPPQEEDGKSCVITLQYVEALRNAAELEQDLGDPTIASRYREAAGRASTGVLKSCWNEKYGLLADTPAQTHFSQHANILGVWLDVVPPAQQQQVLRRTLSGVADKPMPAMSGVTYYFRYYLARALEHAGMGGEYLGLLRPWREMMALGLTTWAEQPEPTRSDSHAWSASPNFDLLTIVAGIRPETPGFGRVRIAPELGNLQKLQAGMPTPHGMVQVSFTREANGLEGTVQLPAGVTGTLEWQGNRLDLNGGEIKEFELKAQNGRGN